jgi:hypothetical protein
MRTDAHNAANSRFSQFCELASKRPRSPKMLSEITFTLLVVLLNIFKNQITYENIKQCETRVHRVSNEGTWSNGNSPDRNLDPQNNLSYSLDFLVFR